MKITIESLNEQESSIVAEIIAKCLAFLDVSVEHNHLYLPLNASIPVNENVRLLGQNLKNPIEIVTKNSYPPLTYDPQDGMIIKGTFIKVESIYNLVVTGSTWSDILRTHPELTEDDIRACIAYQSEVNSNGSHAKANGPL